MKELAQASDGASNIQVDKAMIEAAKTHIKSMQSD